MTEPKYVRPFEILEIIYIMATQGISQEANNYVRLDLAIKDTCTECLRDVFKNCVPFGFQDISHALQFLEPRLKQHLESYKYSQLFSNHQLRANFSVSECDMSLVYSLIRNSNWVPPPTVGWGKSFTNSPQDRSLGANVERLHLFRNILEHCKAPSISNQDFNKYWAEVRKCVSDIEMSLGITTYQQSLECLRVKDLDPDYANRIINEFNDAVRDLKDEQHRQGDCLLEIRKDQSVQGSILSDVTNSLNEQSKDLLDLKTEESNQSKLLRELAIKSEQQYQLLENDRKVLLDIKTSHDHQDINMCEVLDALMDEDKGLVRVVKEQNYQMCTMQELKKTLEEMQENHTLLLNNNKECFKEIKEIMELRANDDSSDIKDQHQNEADNESATKDLLNCNVNRENEISIAEGRDGVICLIKQYCFIKSSLSKRNVRAIVDCFLKEGLISIDEHETISDLYLPRRIRIDHLLKKIILGDSDRLKTFFKVLESVNPNIARTLAAIEVTDQERSRFREVEERALQVANASAPSDSACSLDNSEICFFQYHLLASQEDVDSINDAMLSRFNFSVLDHSNVLHAKTPDEKIQKLCQTMNLCAINVENELNSLLSSSLYNKWIEFRKKKENHDRQHFLRWLNAPVTLVSYVFGCSRLRFYQAENGSIILKCLVEDGFNMASLTRGSLQDNITDLLWKGYMETKTHMTMPVHVTVFIMSPRENGQEEIHFYLDFDATYDAKSKEDSEHENGIPERKILLEELDPTELQEWITKQLDVHKTMIHMLKDKLSGSRMLEKEEMVVFLDSMYELEIGRDLINQFCKENDFMCNRLSVKTKEYLIEESEAQNTQPLWLKRQSEFQFPSYSAQRDSFPMAMNTDQAQAMTQSLVRTDLPRTKIYMEDIPLPDEDVFHFYGPDMSSFPSVISSGTIDILQSSPVHKVWITAESNIPSESYGISSRFSDISETFPVHTAWKTADSQSEIVILKRKLLLEELDPTALTKWITNQLDAQKTKICIFEDKHSRSDMHGKEEMIILLDSLYELENGRDLIKEFCKQNDPYVYRKLFLTTDHHSTEKHKSSREKPLQYERGGGLQKLYSFWIDISSDQKGMKEKSYQTDKLLRTTTDASYPVDEKAPPKPQNLVLSESHISTLHSHSSEFNPGYNIKKTENEFKEPTVWKLGDTSIVVQVGKLDEIWSDAMVIVRMGWSSPDIPRTIIEKVGPQILREFRDKYPFGQHENEVAVLSGFNLPIWRIFYWDDTWSGIQECVTVAKMLKMRSILFLVQKEHFTELLKREVMTRLRHFDFYNPFSSISTIYFHIDQDTLKWRILRKILEDDLSTIKGHKYMLANPEPKVFNVGHMTVITQIGKLDEIKSDALVIFEVTKEQWPTQTLPSEILEKTDPMIQKEFKEKFPAGLEYAEVAALSGYNLPSKRILYGVFPLWPALWLKQVIEVFFAECFQLASDEGIKSIAFMIPSVPYHIAEIYASVLHRCVEMQIYEKPLSILMLNIVIKNGCTGSNMLKKVFEEEWAQRIVFKEGHITIVIQERSLEDILLCTHQMRRGKGTQTCPTLSKESQEKAIIPDTKALVIVFKDEDISDILDEIDLSLMVEFRTKYAYAMPEDEVVILNGYNNPFNKIYCSYYRSKVEVPDIIVDCLQMAENDKMNYIFLRSNPEWIMMSKKLAQEIILGVRIFVIENSSSSIRRLYLDSLILRQEISDVTPVKVFKERHVTVVLNATYKEMEYMYTGLHTCIGRPTNKMNVHVICGVTDVRQYRGRLHGYLEDKIYHQRGFTSGEIFFFQHVVPNTMIVFFGTPRLHRQDMDIFFNKCIQMADGIEVSSVTFLVPNIVERSIKLFASTLISCVKRFAKNTPSSKVKRIYIRIDRHNPQFQKTKQVFEEEWAKTSGEEKPDVLSQQIDKPQEKQGEAGILSVHTDLPLSYYVHDDVEINMKTLKPAVQHEVRNEKTTESKEVVGCEGIERLSLQDLENTDRSNQTCMNDKKIEDSSYVGNQQHNEVDNQYAPSDSKKSDKSGDSDILDRTSLGFWCLCALKRVREATKGPVIISSDVEISDKVLVETVEEINDAKLRKELYLYLSKQIMNQLSHSIKSAKCIVWPGTNLNNEEMVFVLLYKGNIEELPRLYFDKSVFYRDADKPAKHLKYPYRRPTLIDSENNILTYKDAMLIERAIEEYGEDLFRKHNNLEAISGSSFMLSMSKGYIRLPCLVLYCQVKGIVPYGEKMFPKTLQIGEDTLAVDVREGFLRRGMLQPESLDIQNDKLRMGISIGAMDLNISGTLGPFVKLDGGNIGFITCAHVVEGGNGQIVHPANGESLTDMHLSERLCGEVRNIVFNPPFREQNNGLSINVGVDAALVKVKGKRGVDIEKFPSVTPKALERAGFDPSEPPHFRYGSIQYPLDFQCVQGKRVIKYGQTTGLTKGSIQLKGVMVKRRNAELETPTRVKVVMNNQYIVERHGGVPFFTLGDSGAGVFLVGKNNQLILIGLAIGMLDMDHCVVTPIEYVLQALNLSFKNLQFEEDMDVT